MDLLERDYVWQALQRLLADARIGHGCLLLLGGERCAMMFRTALASSLAIVMPSPHPAHSDHSSISAIRH
jgi:hypothetical protein